MNQMPRNFDVSTAIHLRMTFSSADRITLARVTLRRSKTVH
jgi:hypothetical protein